MGSRIKRLAETWDNRWAVAYSHSQRSIGVELNNILAKRDWKVVEAASSVESVFAHLTLGKAALLIIDDTEADPAPSIQRQQLFHPLACLTPTLIFASKHSEVDMKCMLSMGEAIILAKPISPNSVLEAVDQLCERWSQGYLAELRRIAVKMVEGQTQSGFRMLTDIVQGGSHAPLATTALALYYRRQDDIKMTEKLLLSAIKQGSFEMATILPLIDLYLYVDAPNLALRLIEMAFTRFEKPNFLCVDAIQALMMLNRIKDCLPYLQQLAESDFNADLARHYLPRIYYSCGELDQFDRAIKYKPEKFDEFQRSWHLLADDDAERRKSQYELKANAKKQQGRQEKNTSKVAVTPTNKKEKNPPAEQGPSILGKPLFSEMEKMRGEG